MAINRELILICGPMFSQKTAELLLRTKVSEHAGHKILLVDPSSNTRDENVKSRTGLSTECIKIPANQPEKILELARGADVVAIDEVQFFDTKIVNVVEQLFDQGKKVLMAGLDTDAFGKPFGSIHYLMALPETQIIRKRAICDHCKREYIERPATRTNTINKTIRNYREDGKNPILPGDTNLYEALCYDCFRKANPEDFKNTDQIVNNTTTLKSIHAPTLIKSINPGAFA